MDVKSNANDNQLELAKLAIKRLKTLRHPNILTYIDSLEVRETAYHSCPGDHKLADYSNYQIFH